MEVSSTMRCRECGLELDERDRLPSGAYQCPECGAIHHTASSSKVSPSPWRRKRRNSFSSPADMLRERRFGLPLWSWLAIALAAIIAIVVVIVLLTSRPGDGNSDVPAAVDVPIGEATAEPGSELAAPIDDAEEALLTDAAGDAGAANSAPAANTGVALNDFQVGFDWAMNRLNFTSTLTEGGTESGVNGEIIGNYTFADWCQVRLTLDPQGTVIQSATITAKLADGATDNTPVLAAFVSAIYGLDNTISATAVRDEVTAMIADNSRVYQRDAFSASLTGAAPSYTLEITGKRT